MKQEYNQQLGIYENVFPDKYIEDIVKTYKKKAIEHVRNRINGLDGKQINYDKVFEIDPKINKKFANFFFKTVDQKVMPEYLGKYNSFGDIFNGGGGYKYDTFQVQKTSPTEGYHTFHSEWDSKGPLFNQDGKLVRESVIDRVLAWTLYLNDIEEGGETEFLYQSVRVKPKKGLLCIFPAFPTHYHRGNPPLKKDKYIATGWIKVKTNLSQAYNPTAPRIYAKR